jgi:CheY-like chemotaxis protein
MTVLIVEDNKASARFLEVTLQKEKYQTKVAYNAKMALEILAETPDIELIIADIMMPRISGIALINGIKAKSEWADIPVIMCSSLGDVETVKQAAKAGCKHYLIKPVKKMDLLNKVAEALR